jgi:prepilin-type N-terminal cleavage/methylation domain-containing protein
MNLSHLSKRPPASCEVAARGFTLIELLTVIAIIAMLGGNFIAGAFQGARAGAGHHLPEQHQTACLAWQMYAGDNDERLPYNLGMTGSSFRTDLNWVNNVMTWDLSSDNTNLAT